MTALPAPIQSFIDATNAGDSDAFVAAFAPDGVLIDWGKQFDGRDGVAAWNESDNIGRAAHFRVVGAERDGAAWVVTLEVTGKGFNGTSDFRFEVADDLIAKMEITP
jgi:hypothetical protein